MWILWFLVLCTLMSQTSLRVKTCQEKEHLQHLSLQTFCAASKKKPCVTVFAEGTERGWLWLSFFWNTFSNSTVTWFNHLRDSVWQKPSSTHTKSVFKDKYCSFHWLQILYFYIFYAWKVLSSQPIYTL